MKMIPFKLAVATKLLVYYKGFSIKSRNRNGVNICYLSSN